jgi:hypothetical protein
MDTKKQVPLIATSAGKPCPVCGKPSYSRDGVHPQCNLTRADEKWRAALKRGKQP